MCVHVALLHFSNLSVISRAWLYSPLALFRGLIIPIPPGLVCMEELLNPFSTYVPLLYPLKASEDLRFSDVFRGYRSGTLVENGLIFMVHLIFLNH